MRNNDISNQKAPSMLVRVDNFLVKPKKVSFTDKILDKLHMTRYEIDREVALAIKRAFIHTHYHVGLVLLEDEFEKYPRNMFNELTDLPIGDMHIVQDYLDIKTMLDSGEYLYYVDDNEEEVSKIGSNQCISLSTFNKYIFRRKQHNG